MLSTNLLNLPMRAFGVSGVETGNHIREIIHKNLTVDTKYSPERNHIVVLNSSAIAQHVLHQILYENSLTKRYFEWYPRVLEQRDLAGNLIIQLSPLKTDFKYEEYIFFNYKKRLKIGNGISSTAIKISHLLQKILSKKNLTGQCYLPFNLIQLMTDHCFKSFLLAAIHKFTGSLVSTEHVETCCSQNLFSLSIIFSGVQKAEIVVRRFRLSRNQTVNVKISENKYYTFKIFNIHKASIIQYLSQEHPTITDENEDLKKIENYMSPVLLDHQEHLKALIEKCQDNSQAIPLASRHKQMIKSLEKALAEDTFDVNQPFFNSLKKEMIENTEKVNGDHSYIYYLTLECPAYWYTQELIEDEKDVLFYHALGVEQFFDMNSQQVLYRFYQSWMYEMTLKEYFKKMNYNNFNQGCLNQEQFNVFLNDFETLISRKSDALRSEQKKEINRKWFKCKNSFAFPCHLFAKEDQCIEGLTFCYVSHPFKPANSLENFIQFIDSQNQLQDRLLESLKKEDSKLVSHSSLE